MSVSTRTNTFGKAWAQMCLLAHLSPKAGFIRASGRVLATRQRKRLQSPEERGVFTDGLSRYYAGQNRARMQQGRRVLGH